MRREGPDIKRHFQSSKPMCNKGQKPTGDSGTNSSTKRAQDIMQKILFNENVGVYGSDSDDEDDIDDENEEGEDFSLTQEESTSQEIEVRETRSARTRNEPNLYNNNGTEVISAVFKKKRKQLADESTKSKNCRQSKRQNIGHVLKDAVENIKEQNQNNMMIQMINMQMQMFAKLLESQERNNRRYELNQRQDYERSPYSAPSPLFSTYPVASSYANVSLPYNLTENIEEQADRNS
jgi:hypothetical protein